jgi:hypothetical protein
MTDSATIDEAVDLLDCAGWKGYAQAIREQSQQITRLRDALRIAEQERDRARDLESETNQRYEDLLTARDRLVQEMRALAGRGEDAHKLTVLQWADALAQMIGEPSP